MRAAGQFWDDPIAYAVLRVSPEAIIPHTWFPMYLGFMQCLGGARSYLGGVLDMP